MFFKGGKGGKEKRGGERERRGEVVLWEGREGEEKRRGEGREEN